MSSRLLFIGGHAGAGKSTIAGCVAARLSWKLISFGAFVRMKAREAGLNSTDLGVLLTLGHKLTTEAPLRFCSDIIAAYSLTQHESAVLEGLRHATLVSLFKQLGYGDWTRIAYLDASQDVRANRLLARGEAVPVAVIDEHPVDAENLMLRTQADYLIDNDGSKSPDDLCELLVARVRQELSTS